MSNTVEFQGRVNVALSILSHRDFCDECNAKVVFAVAALEGVPFEVLIREAP